MKRIIVIIMYFGFVLMANSQQDLKTDTQPFHPGWNVGVHGGFNFYLAEGNNFLNPYQGSYFDVKDNIGLLGRLSLGYNFTKVVGVRGFVGLAGHSWPDILFDPPLVQKFNSQNATLDLIVNLSNWWFGYDQNRLIDFSMFAGGGVAQRNKAAFTSNIISGIARVGFQGDIRLAQRVDLNLIAESNFISDNYNDYIIEFPLDNYLAFTVGLTYHFKEKVKATIQEEEQTALITKQDIEDKATTKAPITDTAPLAVTEAQPEQLAKQESNPVQTTQGEQAVQEPSAEKVTAQMPQTDLWVNIFYKINKKDIETSRQKEAITKVVEYLAMYPEAKIIVSGYADRGTGTAVVNNLVSKNRAENVTELLKTAYTIPADRIQTKWYGSRKQLFKQNDMNRLTTVNTEGAVPFKK